MLDIDALERGSVVAIRNLIGHRLSIQKENGLANVSREYTYVKGNERQSNEKANIPDYPFASIHCHYATTDGTWLLDISQDADGKTVYTIPFIAYLEVTIHGRGSHSIATELKHRLEIEPLRDVFEEKTDSTLFDTGDLPNNYDFFSTDYVPSTPLALRVRVYSRFKDEAEATAYITRVIAEGLISRYEGDPKPIPVNIDVDSTGVKK